MVLVPVKYLSVVSILFSCSFANGQQLSTVQVPLAVPSEAPLRVFITQRLHMRINEPVWAKLIEPVYAFDRVVIPSGAELQGRVTRLQPVPKMTRYQAILQGDFTPLHWARVEFTSVVIPGGQTMAIKTGDSMGLGTLYAPPRPAKKGSGAPKNTGVLGTARRQAQQQIGDKVQGVIDVVRGPNKKEWVEDYLVKKLPYHPQWYRRNTRFDAVLQSPLEFGSAAVPAATLRQVGLPSVESIAQVRLLTAVSSATADTTTKVEGILSQPMFSADRKLLLPEGTLLEGRVRHVQKGRWFHRGGQLRFTFDRVEPPAITAAPPLPLDRMQVQLAGVEADPQAHIKVDSEGDAKATEPKTRLLGPVLALIVASRGADEDRDRDRVGTGGANGNYGGRTLAGISGFGLLGAAAGRASKTAGAALGYYGLAWSIFSNIISRGKEVEFQKNTAMEVRFGSPASSPSKKMGNRLARAGTE